ncbi:MAG: NAD+ synthase [Legionellales bacterium RIFCSPHIGHO2_12_FULL_35_11]|nr:MAG: NAD+ synthase [Legionellales bacterium RIFCSPHIGHO2_12_FULL_35_11]
MAQINPNIGSISSNCEKIIHAINENQDNHDVIVFPELALTGYLLEDLLFRNELFLQIEEALSRIAAATKNCHVILGHPARANLKIYNQASIFYNGNCIANYNKHKLPNYGVFDEKRYYSVDELKHCVFSVNGFSLRLCICEDLWQSEPDILLSSQPNDILISINASPFDTNKFAKRIEVCKKYANHCLAVIYVNQVGGQDELVFDGQSFVMDNKCQIKALAPAFKESIHRVEIRKNSIISKINPMMPTTALIYQALLCGIRDYVNKNNFKGILLGLSGGIDSALTLALAVDALGPSRVFAVLLPSKYTADISNIDALAQIHNLGISHFNLPINNIFNCMLDTLAPAFKNTKPDTMEENLQARIRGNLLMALSNKTGYMLLSTSNKSESAVGYATLYGDMAGGFAPLKDVLKTTVYELANYRNSISEVIPKRVIDRAPTAELAPNQKDEDSLPNYAILDSIIAHYVHENLDAKAIIELGFPEEIVNKVIKLIFRNEYKRRQSPPGVKITESAFGKDWRRPITQGLF